MKKVSLSFFILGVIGLIITETVLKNTIPENWKFPICLLFLGFIYISFLIGYIIDKRKGETENYKISFWNLRFYLGLFSYPLIVIVYISYKLFEIIK